MTEYTTLKTSTFFSKTEISLSILVIILLSLLMIERCNPEPVLTNTVHENFYRYEPDTITSKKYYALLEAYNNKTPPKEIIKWLKPEPINSQIEVVPDSLILYIKDLEYRLAIAKGYIDNYPEADKLINFELNKKNLSITTLDIKSNMETKNYPLNFDYFKYRWSGNELTHEEIEYKKPKDKTKFNQLYFNIGNDFISKEPKIDLDYSIIYKRLKLNSDIGLILKQEPMLQSNVKIGYRLF